MTILELSRVTVTLAGREILTEVDLAVSRGERVGLVGPSGAGKTSLLRLCQGALAPSAGDAVVLGERIADCTPGHLRRLRCRIGTVPQQAHLVGPMRVVHNVNAGRLGRWGLPRALCSLVRPYDVGTVRVALDRVGIADKIFERTDRLSGGEQQRVSLARVLVQDPDLILADEPVSSLDPSRAKAVMELLTRVVVGSDRALLVSLHDLDLARRYCDRLVGIRNGRVVFDLSAADVVDGTAAELYRIAS